MRHGAQPCGTWRHTAAAEPSVNHIAEQHLAASCGILRQIRKVPQITACSATEVFPDVLQTTTMSKDLDEPIEESILVCGTIWTPKPAVNPRSGQKESSNEESVGTSSLPQLNRSASPTNKPESHSVAEAYQTPPIATIEQEDVTMNTEYDEEDVFDEDELMYPEDEGSDYQPSDMEIDELDSD